MNKMKYRSGGSIDPQDWKNYDDEESLLYSYVKKKGKHKRAKTNSSDKKI